MPARQNIIPLWSAGMRGRSVNATTERRINLYLDRDPGSGDKSPLALYSRPGLKRKYFTGENSVSSFPGGPIRGVVGKPAIPGAGVYSTETVFAAQQANSLFATTLNRFLWSANVYLSTSGPVQFASLGVQTLAVDGVTGYLPGNGTTLQQEGVSDFPAARSICTCPLLRLISAIAAPTAMALVATTFAPGQDRSRAFAIYAAMTGIGSVAGLILGGVCGLQRRATGGVLAPILTHVIWGPIMVLGLPPIFGL